MFSVHLRFYAELNDFLPRPRRQVTFTHTTNSQAPVKDLIESLGVPHTEVDLILVNGESADFSCQLKDNDRVSVYPVFESMDIRPLLRVRPEPLRETKFVLDIHLGRLAAYLRMLGFDTYYQNNSADEQLARISSQQGRILLTRDRRLLKRSLVTHGYCIRETHPRWQLSEILLRFDLFSSARPFQRCMKCNAPLAAASRQLVGDQVPPASHDKHEDFQQCPQCNRVYWKGSHYQSMLQFIDRMSTAADCDSSR
ncbi:MAG: Mut7-C ubiquitin/RNAse domain-containing protein [Acidobacteria bacterium]|nr:Mut7-C ubiquitin/RNAse domain-containing protein [Acidobacteriota bacterium]